MTIKSDKWIRKMAEEHGMIEPFEPKLIREKDNQKIVNNSNWIFLSMFDLICHLKIFTSTTF